MNSTNDERVMTDYLLGTATQEQQDAMDARLVGDVEFFEAMEALEDDLILRWHHNLLPALDRIRFEKAYQGAARQARIKQALALLEPILRHPDSQPHDHLNRWSVARVSRGIRSHWLLAASLCVVSAVVVIMSRRPDTTPAATMTVPLTAEGTRSVASSRGFDLVLLEPEVAMLSFLVAIPDSLDPPDVWISISDNDRGISLDIPASSVMVNPAASRVEVRVNSSQLRDGDYLLTVFQGPVTTPVVVARKAFRIIRKNP